MRERGFGDNDLLARLAADPRLGLDRATLDGLLDQPLQFVGTARSQTQAFIAEVEALALIYPAARSYRPAPML
jgi:adenylosuccinate lyase